MQLPGGQTPPLRVLNCVMFFPVPRAPSLREGPRRGSLLQYPNSLRCARPYLAKEGQLLMQCPHNTRKKTPTVGARSASPIQAPQRRYSQTPSATLVPLRKEGQFLMLCPYNTRKKTPTVGAGSARPGTADTGRTHRFAPTAWAINNPPCGCSGNRREGLIIQLLYFTALALQSGRDYSQ